MSRVTAPIKVGSAVYIRRVTHGYPVRFALRFARRSRIHVYTYVCTYSIVSICKYIHKEIRGSEGVGKACRKRLLSVWIGVSARRAVRLFEKEGPPLFTIFGKLSLIW